MKRQRPRSRRETSNYYRQMLHLRGDENHPVDLVVARPYDLDVHGAWSIDFASVERALTPRTRAVLVVSPNNPTGSFVRPTELDRLAALCAPRDIAIVETEFGLAVVFVMPVAHIAILGQDGPNIAIELNFVRCGRE